MATNSHRRNFDKLIAVAGYREIDWEVAPIIRAPAQNSFEPLPLIRRQRNACGHLQLTNGEPPEQRYPEAAKAHWVNVFYRIDLVGVVAAANDVEVEKGTAMAIRVATLDEHFRSIIVEIA